MSRIKRLVSYYVRKYGTNDPFRLAEALGIYIFMSPLGNVAGTYKYMEHAKCIFINSDIEDEQLIRMIAAHELGHAILHWKENYCFMAHKTFLLTSRIERQASIFAAELLIRDSILFEYAGFSIEQIAMAEGLDQELLRLKFDFS